MKKNLKKVVPNFIFNIYYAIMALLGALIYGFPSQKMIILGVTGTKGKTSTINFIWSCLMAGGHKTGIITTANVRIGDREKLNTYHMTMPGRFEIQRLMSDMVKAGCTHCIIETTSEGIKQYRHIGIDYDILVFTNLFPEHLPSHGGSFKKYKETKGSIFAKLNSSKRKIINGNKIEKVIIANKDSEHSDYFSKFNADKKITFALENSTADYKAEYIKDTPSGASFMIGNNVFDISILGKFNVYNALPAIIIARQFGIDDSFIRRGLQELKTIPGRMEIINKGQDFTVIVDYAHEKESMTRVLETAQSIRKVGAKIIVLLGAEGGGRDKAKRPLMGSIAGRMADYVIVANVDPYDDDPQEILNDIAVATEQAGKVRDQNLFIIEDRRVAINKSFHLAKADDIVIITGKGAEQSMIIGKQTIPWDDRNVVREELSTLRRK